LKTKTTNTIIETLTWPVAITVVSICCFVLLFEIIPTTNITIGVVHAYFANSISNNCPFIKKNLLYQIKYSDEHNIALISNIGLFIFGSSSSHRRNGINSFKNDDKNDVTDRVSDSKLVHSSFRLEQRVIKSLEQVAERRDMSLSALVNKILKNYVTSEMYFEELGFLLVSKNFLRNTFEVLDQKYIADLGREYGQSIAKEYVSYFYPQVNSDTLIQFLDIWFKRFQSYKYREGSNNSHYFMVNHDINMNFSLVLQSTLEGLIEPIIMGTIEFTNVTPSTITFYFNVS